MEHVDLRISRLALHQHGLVTRRQLIDAGLASSTIDDRVTVGRLHRIHRGVYAVGHANIGFHGRALASVLAVGPDAVVTGRWAARLWQVSRFGVGRPEVLVPRQVRGLPGIDSTFTRQLPDTDATVLDDVPIVTLPRLLLELAVDMGEQQLANVMHEASYRRGLDVTAVEELATRFPNRRGTTRLRMALGLHVVGSRGTFSHLEDSFLELLDGAGVEPPETNVPVQDGRGELIVDCLWRSARVVAEVDGEHHGRARSRRTDARRDARLPASGFIVVRVPAGSLHRGVSEVRAALARATA